MARRKPPAPPLLSRRGPVRQPKLALLVFCEGKNTEPDYIRSFARERANSLVRVNLVAPAGAPTTLVEKAKAARAQIAASKNSYERFDQVWVMFDRDEHPNVDQAIAHAEAAGVHVGFSNPCFEVWLLLHYGNFDAPDHRHDVQRKFAEHDKHYDRKGSKELNYPALSSNYALARERAIRMRARRREEGRAKGEPYTDVDMLTELIVANGKGEEI